jgi:peptidylprolyl isomerase
MKSSLIVSSIAALLLAAVPAAAKDKPKPAPAQPALSSLVDLDPTHDAENVVDLDLSNGGRVVIRLMPQWAPNHVERIKTLVRQHFYDGLIFHRVIDGFMAQTGDPTGTGGGGSQLPDLKAEFNALPHVRGTVSMARTDNPDSANSQFFIVFYPRFSLDRKYTVFGRVIAGMDVVDRIERGEPPTNPTKILHASLGSEGVPPPVQTAAPALPQGPVTEPAEAPAAADEIDAAPVN